jgi:hypothetical protein
MAANDDPAIRPKTSPGVGRGSKSPRSASGPARNSELLALTINAKTGQIVRVESVDSSGARHELSEEQWAKLAQEKGTDTLEALIEGAFEAGVASVLGDRGAQFGPSESEEEAELRHLLLRPMIEHSPAKHLMKRDTLTRATLGTLLRHNIGPEPRDAESKRPQRPSRGSASKSHQPGPSLGSAHE